MDLPAIPTENSLWMSSCDFMLLYKTPSAIKLHLLWGFNFVNISKSICQWIAESLVVSWGSTHTECLLPFCWQLNDKPVQVELFEVTGNEPISMLICLKYCFSDNTVMLESIQYLFHCNINKQRFIVLILSFILCNPCRKKKRKIS